MRGLVEKPDPSEAPSRLAIIGRYVLMLKSLNTSRNLRQAPAVRFN